MPPFKNNPPAELGKKSTTKVVLPREYLTPSWARPQPMISPPSNHRCFSVPPSRK